MSSCTVLGGIPVSKPGLNYLVPSHWWKQFLIVNHSRDLPSFSISPLNILDYVDDFLLQFQEPLLQELQLKCNYLKCQSVKISLQPSRNLSWTAINPVLWKTITQRNKSKHGILTVLSQDKHYQILDTIQIQIIYCSKNRSEAFVGYIPKKANLALTIREIGYDLGYVEVSKSKISFLDKNPEISFRFHEVEKYRVADEQGTAFLAFNMEQTQEDPTSDNQFNVIFQKLANESNQAVVGDQNTMEDYSNHLNEPIINHTMSTGAETPFSFALSQGFDLDREYRVKELFGTKQPEEIQELKELANIKIEDQAHFLPLPQGDEKSLQLYLDKLADELLDGFQKKKIIPKEKQKQLEFNFQ